LQAIKSSPLRLWVYLAASLTSLNTSFYSFFLLYSLVIFSANSIVGVGWVNQWSAPMCFLLFILALYCCSKRATQPLHLIVAFLYLFFIRSNVISLFLFYEAILLPIAFLVLKSGSEPERVRSVCYMLMYTILGSVPFFIVGIYLVKLRGSLSLPVVLKITTTRVMAICLRLTFLTKLPVWGVHLWLPLAHVFSPLVGRIILAGIMLKAGAYGLHLVFIISRSRDLILFIFIGIATVGAIFSFFKGVTCLDGKAVIAFSRIIHMAWVVSLLVWGRNLSEMGLLMLLIGHGIRRPLLFSLVASYSDSGSRSLFYRSNLTYPLITLFILMLAINCGFPPSLNFLREIICFIVLCQLSSIVCFLFFVVFLLGGFYSLFIWLNIFNAKNNVFLHKFHWTDPIMIGLAFSIAAITWL